MMRQEQPKPPAWPKQGFIDLFQARPLISYEAQLQQCLGFWQQKVESKALALATGRRCLEPIQYPGVARLHKIRTDFASSVAEWQPYQSDVFEMFVNANITNILGRDVDRCLESVMRESNWKDVPDEMLVVAARGSGKSTLLACAIAAFLKNIENYTAMVYSGLQAKSNDLLDSIWTAFCGMRDRDPDFAATVSFMKKTSKKILIVVNGDCRQIQAASSFGMVSHTFPPQRFNSHNVGCSPARVSASSISSGKSFPTLPPSIPPSFPRSVSRFQVSHKCHGLFSHLHSDGAWR